MSNSLSIQTRFSIPTGDLEISSSVAKYPLGTIVETESFAPDGNTASVSKYIYARQLNALAQYQPGLLQNIGVEGNEFSTLGPNILVAAPGFYGVVPQITIPVNDFGFFLIEGWGKADCDGTVSILSLVELRMNDTQFSNTASISDYAYIRGSLSLDVTPNAVNDILLFYRSAGTRA